VAATAPPHKNVSGNAIILPPALHAEIFSKISALFFLYFLR